MAKKPTPADPETNDDANAPTTETTNDQNDQTNGDPGVEGGDPGETGGDPGQNDGDAGEAGDAVPKHDLEQLKTLVLTIEHRPGQTVDAFAAQLEKEHGAKFRTTTQGRTYLKLADIEVGGRGGKQGAITNWCNNARRLLLAGA